MKKASISLAIVTAILAEQPVAVAQTKTTKVVNVYPTPGNPLRQDFYMTLQYTLMLRPWNSWWRPKSSLPQSTAFKPGCKQDQEWKVRSAFHKGPIMNMDFKFELTSLLRVIDAHLRTAAPNVVQTLQLNTSRLNRKPIKDSRLATHNFWASKTILDQQENNWPPPEILRLIASYISMIAHALGWYKKPNTADEPEFHKNHFNAIIF